MTAAQSLKIYEILNQQFGKPEAAREVVEAIEAVVTEKVEAGNKQYESILRKDLEIVRVEIRENGEKLRAEMKEQKSELIKWMFIFWVSQIAATLGVILLFLKK